MGTFWTKRFTNPISFVWYVSTVFVFVSPGLLGAQVKSSIVAGRNVKKGDWPWMVHLNISDGTQRFRCGGTLLNSEWVLTSAGCLDRYCYYFIINWCLQTVLQPAQVLQVPMMIEICDTWLSKSQTLAWWESNVNDQVALVVCYRYL